ncbi:MAG: hypothetical protein M3Y51_03180, partial [Actinomycetota bacterium]|nr:hypothetical protein [Actinomycetota bacterium]
AAATLETAGAAATIAGAGATGTTGDDAGADATADADKLASAAAAYIGVQGSELLQECVQFHGGIGVTFEHDLHLFLRRHTLNRALWGTPAEHRRRIAAALEDEVRRAESAEGIRSVLGDGRAA